MNTQTKQLPLTFGTAGHIDHGKTALVRALTGIETDRLKAEKERGITIELGYAYLDLPPYRIGLVDVPGHEKLVRTMIAGASGLDLVLFIVAADEGIKPQTLEHLSILHYMGIQRGILVLTKADLASKERIEAVEADFLKAAAGTFMATAPTCCVSAKTGEGLEGLKDLLLRSAEALSQQLTARMVHKPEAFRMPVDRLFQLSGVGTIAAGTVLGGSVAVGEALMLYPSQKLCKVRQLEAHHQKAEFGYAGQRVALNLSGQPFEAFSRGDVLAAPESLALTDRLEADVRLSGDSDPLSHYSRLRLYLGAKELLCRLILIDREVLRPLEKAYVQLKLEQPFVCRASDSFVLRAYSPARTIGGGVVTRVHGQRQKRKDLLQNLGRELSETTELEEALERQSLSFMDSGRLPTLQTLGKATGQSESDVALLLQLLKQKQMATDVLEGWLSTAWLESLEAKVVEGLGDYHRKFPLARGMGKEALRARIFKACRAKIFDELLNIYLKKDMIVIQGQTIALKTFQIRLSREQQKKAERFMTLLDHLGFQLKTAADIAKMAGFDQKDEGLLSYILEDDAVVGLDEGLVIHRTWLGDAKSKLTAYLQTNGSIDAAGFRDLLLTNRKVSIALLEYFDASNLTIRVDNKRQLK